MGKKAIHIGGPIQLPPGPIDFGGLARADVLARLEAAIVAVEAAANSIYSLQGIGLDDAAMVELVVDVQDVVCELNDLADCVRQEIPAPPTAWGP